LFISWTESPEPVNKIGLGVDVGGIGVEVGLGVFVGGGSVFVLVGNFAIAVKYAAV